MKSGRSNGKLVRKQPTYFVLPPTLVPFLWTSSM